MSWSAFGMKYRAWASAGASRSAIRSSQVPSTSRLVGTPRDRVKEIRVGDRVEIDVLERQTAVRARETQDGMTLTVVADEQDRHGGLESLLAREPRGVDPGAREHLDQQLAEVVVADGTLRDRLDPELRQIGGRTGGRSGSRDSNLVDHVPAAVDRRPPDRPGENVDDMHAEAHDSARAHSIAAALFA
jgi:hypothetical protein